MAGATENAVLDKGYDAAGAVRKGHAVRFVGLETVAEITADTQAPIGVSMFEVTLDDIARGKGVSVRRPPGAALMKSAGAINPGDTVRISPNGRAIATGTGTIIGICDEGCANADEYVRVTLHTQR
jgi:hypothetical protein